MTETKTSSPEGKRGLKLTVPFPDSGREAHQFCTVFGGAASNVVDTSREVREYTPSLDPGIRGPKMIALYQALDGYMRQTVTGAPELQAIGVRLAYLGYAIQCGLQAHTVAVVDGDCIRENAAPKFQQWVAHGAGFLVPYSGTVLRPAEARLIKAACSARAGIPPDTAVTAAFKRIHVRFLGGPINGDNEPITIGLVWQTLCKLASWAADCDRWLCHCVITAAALLRSPPSQVFAGLMQPYTGQAEFARLAVEAAIANGNDPDVNIPVPQGPVPPADLPPQFLQSPCTLR